MKLRVKNKFLAYEIDDVLPISLLSSDAKYYTSQIKQGNLEVINDNVEKVINARKAQKSKEMGIFDRVKDYVEDLLDDGKRNYSNNPNKGRKLSKKKTKKKKINKRKRG